MKKYRMNWAHFLFMVIMWSSVIALFLFLYANREVENEIYQGYTVAPTQLEVDELEINGNPSNYE